MKELKRFSPELLKQRRKERGLSVEALARAVGVSLSAVLHWEAGRHEPNARQIAPLARALAVRIDYFWTEGTGGHKRKGDQAVSS